MVYANTRGEIFFNPRFSGGPPCLHALRAGGSSGDSSGAGPSHLSQPVRRMLNNCL